MVFVFQPIFMSFLPRPRIRVRNRWRFLERQHITLVRVIVDWLVRLPVTPGVARGALMAGGAAFIVWGAISGQRARVGYQTPGIPLYRPDAKVNRDIAEIGKFFPTDEGWLVLSTPDYPDPQSGLGPEVLRMADDLDVFLVSRGDALATVPFAAVIKPLNSMFHNGYPKFNAIPTGFEQSKFQKVSVGVGLAGNGILVGSRRSGPVQRQLNS
jgi:hypothetical protein